MKQIKFITILFFASCLFASCHHDDGPSKEVVQKMKETAQEWAAYLSDNYQVKDSVFFLRTDLETQETQVEKFRVVGSDFYELAYEQESNDMRGYLHEEDDSNFSLYIYGYTVGVQLYNREHYLGVSMSVTYDEDIDQIYERSNVNINNSPCLEVSHQTIDKDYFTVTSCDNTCTMQRNVGIIKFSNDQYSWESIKKN